MTRLSVAAVVAVLMVAAAALAAQAPVVWSLERENAQPVKPLRAGASFIMLVKAEIEFGWHLYATTQPPGGPIATEVRLVEAVPFTSGGALGTEKPAEGFDPNFNLVTEYYEDHTVFRVPVTIAPTAKDGRYTLTINVRYQSCNDTLCIPPRSQALKMTLVVDNPAAIPVPATMSPESRVRGALTLRLPTRRPRSARTSILNPQSSIPHLLRFTPVRTV